VVVYRDVLPKGAAANVAMLAIAVILHSLYDRSSIGAGAHSWLSRLTPL
jgi:hypothetical protein